jgi:hypothetical protein
MPKSTSLVISLEVQAPMLAALRRARYGYVLALHMVLLCAAGRTPTDIAAVLFCSRSGVYRTVRAYRTGTLGIEPDDAGRLSPPLRTSVLVQTLRRSLLALLKVPSLTYGWCRTRWSCGTLAATFQAKRGLIWCRRRPCGAWSTRSDGCESGPSSSPRMTTRRGGRLARMRVVYEQLPRWEAVMFADELDIHYCPRWAMRGCRKALRWRSRRPELMRSITWQ